MNDQIAESTVNLEAEAPLARTITLAELAMVGGGDSTAFNLY
jgi:hypothetical protein